MRLPYTTQIGGGLRENCSVKLIGQVFEKATSFTVRFACGEDCKDDTPFTFTAKIKSNQIAVQSQNSTCWFKDEMAFDTKYFSSAAFFELTITCTSEGFLVIFDTEEHTYPHKLPYYCVRYITIDGDIHLKDLKVTGVPAEEEQIRVPLTKNLPQDIVGKKIIVHGIPVRAKPYKTMLDFMSSDKTIAFHFNPRFNDAVLVRNNLVDDVWKKEERELAIPFPFSYGVAFQLEFHVVEENHYDVKLNGLPLCKFQRQTPGRIKDFRIFGSVVVTKVEVA